MSFIGHKLISKPDGSTRDSWYTYTCGHCNSKVAGAVVATVHLKDQPILWLLCTNCANGSVRADNGNIFPGVPFGPKIEGLPDVVLDAYEEARRCLSINAFTSCELICRKILMHVAVDKGASEGDTFANYLSYLETKGFVTPPMKTWVDLIRQHGNKAAHLIEPPEITRAESTLMFTAELLRLTYEMEYLSKKYVP